MRPMMRFVFVAALLAAGAVAADKPDFSGEWKINMAKSDFGPAPPAPSFIIRVTHAEPSLTIVQEHGIEDDNSTRALTVGGKEIAFQSRGADVTTKVVWEGGALVFSSNVKGADFEVLQKSTWSLAGDGNALKIVEHGQTPGGDYEMILVFDRQ